MTETEVSTYSFLAKFDTIWIERVPGKSEVEIFLWCGGELIAGAQVPQGHAGEHVSWLFELSEAFSD
jgi:hypothetical protein